MHSVRGSLYKAVGNVALPWIPTAQLRITHEPETLLSWEWVSIAGDQAASQQEHGWPGEVGGPAVLRGSSPGMGEPGGPWMDGVGPGVGRSSHRQPRVINGTTGHTWDRTSQSHSPTFSLELIIHHLRVPGQPPRGSWCFPVWLGERAPLVHVELWMWFLLGLSCGFLIPASGGPLTSMCDELSTTFSRGSLLTSGFSLRVPASHPRPPGLCLWSPWSP